MPSSVQPILVTRDLERLTTFYAGLRIGDSDVGLVADGRAPEGHQRMLLSVDVPDVDALLPRVDELGGHVQGPANDMPWGQRVAHVQDADGNTVNLTQQR